MRVLNKDIFGITPFDESNADEDISINRLSIESKSLCSNGSERMNILLSPFSQELMNIQLITSAEKFSDKEKYNIGKILNMNTEIESKIDTKTSRYRQNIHQNKMLIKYVI